MRPSAATTFGSRLNESSCAGVSASGFRFRVRSGSLFACTSFCIAVSISDGIAKMPTLATAIASVSTVKTARALRRVRSVTDFLRSADAMTASSLFNDEAVADRHHAPCPSRQPEVVCDVEDGLALVVEPLQQLGHLRCGLGVEVAGRLVADDQLRVGRERACDRDPLLLAAGELRGQVVELVLEADQLEVVLRDLVALSLGALAREVEWQHCVLERCECRQQLEELEDDADVSAAPDRELLLAQRVNRLPIDRHRSVRG